MNRRGFLGVILATGIAPALIRHAMPVRVLEASRIDIFGGALGIYDDVVLHRGIVAQPEVIEAQAAMNLAQARALFGHYLKLEVDRLPFVLPVYRDQVLDSFMKSLDAKLYRKPT